ncbi:four-carbon acid sugar kinase family protein [Herbiconiux sp. SYSU D00978]|uniref:four-carbon acid sugar kinase family protein n=1 Tax=Herbiconiux sp. SYSU D00978 TaxID=2812562 RepID=UPI001A96D31F|nr:four-carbon acid sugar kinase family protein [Herbiconiux sp. SYSU D00978]
MPELPLAFYGDDFTGSVDVLLQLRRAGWRSRLLLGLPDSARLAAAAEGVDALGIAGIARSLPTEHIDAEVRPALEALRGLGARVVQYKACSTADSSPGVGSLGRVIEIAREVFGAAPVPALFAQPDFGRFTAFGHHFAAEDGVVHRLDRQPTMSSHPVTPMHESDLAVHLSRQTALPIGHIPFTHYASPQAVALRLAEAEEAALVLDALSDDDVALVAEAIASIADPARPQFVLGSGGLSSGLGRALAVTGEARAVEEQPLNPVGAVLAVSGSRSPQTARQVRAAELAGWASIPLPLEADDPVAAVRERVLAELRAGRSVVVTTGETEVTDDGSDLVGRITGQLAALLATALQAEVTRRVIVCGGDTSSRVVRLLGADSLSIAANPVGNVVLCSVSSTLDWLDGVEMLLKGGQVGPVDLFDQVRLLVR